MTTSLEHIKRLLNTADETSRKALLHELHSILTSAETPAETARRIALYPLQASAARIGQDLKIFEILATSGPKTLEELQQTTNAHPTTLKRILRYLASIGFINEVGRAEFDANAMCHNLATDDSAAILTHFFENGFPLFQEMPAFLRKAQYRDITEQTKTVLQPALKTDLDAYSWFSQNPEHMGALVKYMAVEQKVRSCWMGEYPIEPKMLGCDPGHPVFVDVGGNVGYYCAKFKSHFPSATGRVILQDLPHAIAQALPTPGVEPMVHNFFEPQPIKGAQIYHLGWVLHNWNDEKVKQILRRIKEAMSPQSLLLINDMILPETGAPDFASSLDLIMLCAFGSRERTMKEWTGILDDVGLVVKESNVYSPDFCHGIIGVALK